jgi:hypothetical protein
MYIDNLTLAGLAAASLYLLIPFLFGREVLCVEMDVQGSETQQPDPANDPQPCLET